MDCGLTAAGSSRLHYMQYAGGQESCGWRETGVTWTWPTAAGSSMPALWQYAGGKECSSWVP